MQRRERDETETEVANSTTSRKSFHGERNWEEEEVYCRTKWPKRSLPNIKSIDTISVRPLTAESIKKCNDSSVQDAAKQ